MENLKSFIYLDEYKMYSLSSQMFKGLTEYLTEYSDNENIEQEQQKGPLNSGRIIGDIIKKSEGKEEKKFLHDYAYLLFEQRLEEEQKIINITQNDKIFDGELSFVKATGRIKFTDFNKLSNTVKDFNRLGSALGNIIAYSSQQTIKGEVEESIAAINDRNEKIRVRNKMESAIRSRIKDEKEKMGLHIDEKYLKDMGCIFEYGFNDLFEIEMPIQYLDRKISLSCSLNRHYLRESENLLISKYSRATEKEIVIVGIVTQSFQKKDREIFTLNGEQENANIRRALIALFDQLINVEDNFIGKMEDEIIIDPIALYLEL